MILYTNENIVKMCAKNSLFLVNKQKSKFLMFSVSCRNKYTLSTSYDSCSPVREINS